MKASTPLLLTDLNAEFGTPFERTFKHVRLVKIQISLHSLFRILTGRMLDSQ